MKPWMQRVLMALVVVSLYMLIWQPARGAWGRYFAFPVLASTLAVQNGTLALDLQSSGRAIILRWPHELRPNINYPAPGGVLLGLTAFAMAWMYPRRPYWGYVWILHVAFGLLAFALLWVAVGIPALISAYRFTSTYVYEALALITPIIIWLHARSTTPSDLAPAQP